MAPPVVEAVEWCRRRSAAEVVLLSPQGERLDERCVLELRDALLEHGELVLICGHYKGVDERIRELVVTREISIGDYVLSGGELPALVVVDAVVRRLPGVLHDEESAASDSFTELRGGGLDCPWYTRPPVYRNLAVPEVLLSGHHAKIERWRTEQATLRTRSRRPDLPPGANDSEHAPPTAGHPASEDERTR
jgi:tRNA (guanine37-N1)-methyltransferase